MLRKLYLFCFAICLLLSDIQAQDPVFSQFFAAPLQLNPAFAGVTVAPRFSFNHRNQFSNWPSAYKTYAASFEQSIEGLNSGVGMQLVSDVAGDGIYKTTYFSGVYAYKVRLNNNTFARLGLEAGFVQNRLDWDKLLFEDQLHITQGEVDENGNPILSEEIQPEQLSHTRFDASVGLLFYNDKFYGGLSLKHLNRYDESFLQINENLLAGIPMRMTLHAGAEIDLGRRNKAGGQTFISPSVMFVKQADTGIINAGAYAGGGRFFGGAWFRHNFTLADAVILMAGVKEGIVSVAYSYDITVSKLANAPGGTGNTHELSFIINIEDSKEVQRKRRAARWNNCLKMFH